MRAVAPQRLAALAITVAALVGCTSNPSQISTPAPSPPPTPAPTGLATFHRDGLVFEYPAAWREFHFEDFSTRSTLIAYLATVEVGAPCVTTGGARGSVTECRQRYQLEPGSLVVAIRSNGMPMFNILDRPPGATPLVIGGLPGYSEEAPAEVNAANRAERTLTVTAARPGSVDNYYTITADLRGPDLARLQAQVEALVASLRYDPPVVPLPVGPNAAAEAAATALAILARDQPAWACFTAAPSRQMLISSVPMGPELAHPQLATCTTRIEATPLQLWRMTLSLRLPETDPQVGDGQGYVVWVNPDGTPGATSGGPLVP